MTDDRIIRQIVRDELRRILTRGIAVDDRAYSTRAGCAPEGYSRDVWRDLARRIGVRRGRYWYVTAAALDAYERGDRQTTAPRVPSTWSPAEAARAIGLRAVGGSR